MNAYIYQADIYCEDCAAGLVEARNLWGSENSGDSEVTPQGPYENGGGEADCPQHCGDCGLFLENPLTSDGVAYTAAILEARNRGYDSRVIADWAEFYKHELADYAKARAV